MNRYKLLNINKYLLKHKINKINNTNNISNISNINNINNTNNPNKIIGTLQYVNKNYPNAPPLIQFSKNYLYDTKDAEQDNNKLCDTILYHFKKNNLSKFFGEIIYQAYSSDNTELQSLWSSDVSRLTFLIRKKTDKNDINIWLRDKKGIEVGKIIIKPLISIIVDLLKQYNKVLEQKVLDQKDNISLDDKFNDLKKRELIIKALIYCDDKMNQDLIKYIAPKFALIQ